jgi:glycyl-tRNA synthetase
MTGRQKTDIMITNMAKQDVKLEDLVSLAKRRGFIYQGSEIYGGLAGTWDYGPLGTILKRNIVNEWWEYFVDGADDMLQVDTAILMNPKVWQASGHISTFTDPLIEDLKNKKRYRVDHLLKEAGIDSKGMTLEAMVKIIKEKKIKSPDGNELGNAAQFNILFETSIGAVEDTKSVVYLRGETAQGMFVNFKNILDSFSPDLPFGIAQVGRCFRNEISPRDFIFRVREFEIMELEYFIEPQAWEAEFEKWRAKILGWFGKLGLDVDKIAENEIPPEDRAHYSKRTIDFYYDFPSLGSDEIAGLAYRTDFDLKNHQELSGKSMEYRPKNGGVPFIPHVIEPTFGLDRHILAVLANAYTVDEQGGERRVFLKLPVNLAPVKVAVSPLLKNKPELVKKAREVYKMLKEEFKSVMWDDNSNIGKRYRRQDEIGTPYCVTIDFDTLKDDTVTIRHRDTTGQKRVKIVELKKALDLS